MFYFLDAAKDGARAIKKPVTQHRQAVGRVGDG